MKYSIFYAILILIASSCKQQPTSIESAAKIELADAQLLIGEWTGSLTYLDYTTSKPYTMPADLIVGQGKTENQLILNNIFPNESSANNSDKLTISKDRTLLNNQTIISRTKLSTGEIQIKTRIEGKDNRKKALIQHTYVFGQNSYSDKKEVQFESSDEWIVRNEFSYVRRDVDPNS